MNRGLPLATTYAVGFIVRPTVYQLWEAGFLFGEEFLKTLIALLAFVFGVNSYAATSSTSTNAADSSATSKASSQELSTKQVGDKQDDIDSKITNAKLRAESGSKSKHSASMVLNYAGGTIDNPMAYNRPNINGAAATSTLTSLAGDVKYRYRISPEDSISAGVGILMRTPGYDLQDNHSALKKYNASEPFISYTKAFKAGNFQNVLSLGFTYYTNPEYVLRDKNRASLNFTHTGLTEIGTSGWQLGLVTSLTYYNYSDVAAAGLESQQEYNVGLFPIAEYVFNDRYNFRTVFRGSTYYSMRSDSMSFAKVEPTQSMGLGIAATRDLFFYPNVQWTWHDPRGEKTNVAVSATMNFL